MRSLKQLIERGQSPWYDNLSRSIIENGDLEKLIARGIVGITSNPTIFDQSISSSKDYDQGLAQAKSSNRSSEETYWDLVCKDITDAADILKPVYDSTKGRDGYVSVEVSPLLAHDSVGTISQANELFARISRDNVMIKIPATEEGLVAIEAVIANSIPVNVTLIFSQERYLQVVQAFKNGAEKAAKIPSSVASFFISRLDTKVDSHLEERSDLVGKAAVANAVIVYDLFNQSFTESEQSTIAQRPLWASTSTKNPTFSPTLYVDELIAPNTVNTLPHVTIDAIENSDGDFPGTDMISNLENAKNIFNTLQNQVPMDMIMKELEDEGVAAFEKSYLSCLESISSRLEQM